MLVSHRGIQQLTKTKKEEYEDDNEGTITTTSCRGGQEVSYRRRHGHDDRWFCDARDEQDQDHETEREVAFADELPRRARGDLHRATGGSGLDSKIGDLDRRMSRLAVPLSPSAGSANPPTQPQPQPQQLCSTGEGDESGEERRRSPVSSFTAVVDITTSTTPSSLSPSSAARLPLVAEREEDDEPVHAAAHEQDQSEQDVEDEDEDEEEEEEENEEEDEEAELVEVDEDEAERAEEVAEELAAFDAATETLLHLLDELRDDNGQYRYRRGQVVAVAGGVRTLKQRVEDFAEPLAGFCPAQAAQLRLAVRSLSNAVVQLLNGLQAGTQGYIESKMAEVRGLVVTLRPLLVQFLLEACAEAEANQDLIRQAAYLKEAAHVGTETVKLLKRAWEEMLDTSVLAANIKHMIRLCVLAADKAHGMREPMAKRLKRRCLRLGKACESLMRGVRQGVEVDEQFEKLVLALSEWLAALNKAHQDIRLVR